MNYYKFYGTKKQKLFGMLEFDGKYLPHFYPPQIKAFGTPLILKYRPIVCALPRLSS